MSTPANISLQRTAPCGLAAELGSFGLAAILVLTLVTALEAQPRSTGALYVAVNDEIGGTLPGACVFLDPESKSIEPSARFVTAEKRQANANGFARFNLEPGPYRVKACLNGFKESISRVTISRGRVTVASVALRIHMTNGDPICSDPDPTHYPSGSPCAPVRDQCRCE